jgi:hypothetical protein
MSRLVTRLSGGLTVVLISGAAQLAMGRDLTSVTGRLPQIRQPLSLSSSSPSADVPAINRGAKGDRTAPPAGSPASMNTVSLKLNSLTDTTVLVRIPVAAGRPSAASPAKPVTRKPLVACEPMVSVLTEVAKQLQPGRCVS